MTDKKSQQNNHNKITITMILMPTNFVKWLQSVLILKPKQEVLQRAMTWKIGLKPNKK